MILPLAALLLVGTQKSQTYHAWLETPGGALSFGLDLARGEDGQWTAAFLNGEERIPVPRVEFDGEDLLLEVTHYDSRIRAKYFKKRGRVGDSRPPVIAREYIEGVWEKRRGKDEVARLPFYAALGQVAHVGTRDRLLPGAAFRGRWAVDFASDDAPAVAVFSGLPGTDFRGTFLTATGDYRYLAGHRTDSALELSCFDGAHAFLFHARPEPDGTLSGDFWSGDWHHDTWTAVRDDDATLPDGFGQTTWNGKTRLADLRFPDLDGVEQSLADFAGKGTLLVVFGSWCPNCHDEAAFLAELDARYRERGLRILGLAFELTGEHERDAAQVRVFAERHGLDIPYFLCGTANKEEATKALGLVDRVRSFPTTVFVGPDGLPKAIHSGFAGPATGEEHAKLRREFEERIEALLK